MNEKCCNGRNRKSRKPRELSIILAKSQSLLIPIRIGTKKWLSIVGTLPRIITDIKTEEPKTPKKICQQSNVTNQKKTEPPKPHQEDVMTLKEGK